MAFLSDLEDLFIYGGHTEDLVYAKIQDSKVLTLALGEEAEDAARQGSET